MAMRLPTWTSSTTASINANSIQIEDKILMRDQSSDEIYEVFVKNGELICQAQKISVRREDRFKKLLDE